MPAWIELPDSTYAVGSISTSARRGSADAADVASSRAARVVSALFMRSGWGLRRWMEIRQKCMAPYAGAYPLERRRAAGRDRRHRLALGRRAGAPDDAADGEPPPGRARSGAGRAAVPADGRGRGRDQLRRAT